MPSKFRPIMLLGLGEYGSIIAQEIFSSLDEKDKNLSQIISCLTFNESGVFSDFKTKKNIFTCDGLNPDLNSLKFKENYEIIQKYESEFESVLSESIDNIRNQEIKSRLRTDYEIEDTISLFIFSSLSDTLGSISIVLFLYYINRLFTERFNAVQIEKNVFGFFPDLFNDYKSNNYAYARSYACLQELDFLGDNPTHILSQGFLYDYIYLFTESNEKGESIGTYKDMIPMITEVLFSLLTGEITSENLDMTHINNVEGKTPRYNSFGLTKLIFPIDNIMKGITDFLTYNFLNHKISNNPRKFPKIDISADVKEFMLKNKFDINYKLSDDLYEDNEGKTIWEDFVLSKEVNANTILENFKRNIEEDSRKFDRETATRINKKLSNRIESFFKNKQDNLLNTVGERTDSIEKGIFYSKAFLDVILNMDEDSTKGEVIEKQYSLEEIKKVVKNFFDESMEEKRKMLVDLKQSLESNKYLLQKLKDEYSEKSPDDILEEKQFIDNTESKTKVGDSKKSDNLNKEEKSLEEKIRELENEIKVLEKKHNKLYNEIITFDYTIEDHGKRRNLLNTCEGRLKDDIKKVEENLEKKDNEYREEQRNLKQLEIERKKFINNIFILYPIIGSVLFSIFIFAANRLIAMKIWDIGIFYIIGIAIYGLWGFIKYRNGLYEDIKKKKELINRLKAEKNNLFIQYKDNVNSIFKTRFDHTLHGRLLEKIIEYQSFVRVIHEKIKSFIKNIIDCSKAKQEFWNNLTFPNNLFNRSIVKRDNVVNFINTGINLSNEMKLFFEQNPLSIYFNEYIKEDKIESLLIKINEYSENIFQAIRETSIEEFLKNEESNNRIDTVEKLNELFTLAKPFILLSVEEGLDESFSLTNLGVVNSNDSYVKQVLTNQFIENNYFYSTGNKNEIVVSKLKIGFPVFYVALIKFGHRLVQNKNDYYINPEWSRVDLFPSDIDMDYVDEIDRIACLGTALGFIQKKGKKYIINSTEVGTTKLELFSYLKSFVGIKSKNELIKNIDEIMEKESSDQIIDKLITHKKENALDDVEKKIIDTTIDNLA